MKTLKQILYMAVGTVIFSVWVQHAHREAWAYHNFFFRDAGDITSGLLDNNRIDPSSVSKLGPSIEGSEMGDNSIQGRNFGLGVVISTHIGDNAIAGSNIANRILVSSHIGNNAIAGGNLAAGIILSTHIGDNKIAGSNLAASIIYSTHIGQMSRVWVSSNIGDNAIGGGNLAAGIVLSTHLGASLSPYNYFTVVVGTSASGTNANVNFVTTDQTGINTALDLFGTDSRGILRVRRGTYTFTGPVQSSANITIDCEDGATFIPTAATTKLVSTSGTIRGCTFSSGGQGVNYTGSYMLMLNSSATAENITVANSKLTHGIGNWDSPIIMTGWHPVLKNLKVRGVDLFGSLGQKNLVKFVLSNMPTVDGADIESTHANTAADTFLRIVDSTEVIMNNIRVVSGSDLNYTIMHRGLADGPSTRTVLTNSYFEGVGAGDGAGVIPLDLSNNFRMSNNTFVQKTPAGAAGTAIGFGGFGLSSNTFITGNDFYNWSTVISITASGRAVIVHGNDASGVTTFLSDSGVGTKARDNFVNDTIPADTAN